MWKTLLMKAFQPLSSPSNNILGLPCQQRRVLRRDCHPKLARNITKYKRQIDEPSGKGPPEEGASLWCSTVKENSLGERIGGFLLCLFIMIKIFLFLTGTEQILKRRKTLPTVQQNLITTSQCFRSHLEQAHNLLPCSGHTALWVMVAEGWLCLLGRCGGAAPSCPAEGPENCW